MTAGLLDTDVLVAYREASETAVAFVEAARTAGTLRLSQASALALYAWCRDDSARDAVRAFLSPATVHPVSTDISRRSFKIMSALPPPPRLSPIDVMVAATALIEKLPLYSLDPERYAGVPGLTVLPAR
jgi:predicted nucleic acid-binding protein